VSVYFVAGGAYVKIGFTDARTPGDRLTAMQTGSPVKLKVLAFVPGGRTEEQKLHARFATERRHGEWFAVSQELARLIAYAKRFQKLDGFEDWVGDPGKLAFRAATELPSPKLERAERAIDRATRLTNDECWEHALRLWDRAEEESVFRAEEHVAVTFEAGAHMPMAARHEGVGWFGRGETRLLSDKKGVQQTAAAIGELVRVGAKREHFIALWFLAALRDCEASNIPVPGQEMLTRGLDSFLGRGHGIWHWATKGCLPESFEFERRFQSINEFVAAVYRLRAQTLLCSEIVDGRVERDGVLWYGNSGQPLIKLPKVADESRADAARLDGRAA
jgi:hypothetical protein